MSISEATDTVNVDGRFWEAGYADMGLSTMGGPSAEVIEIAPFLSPGSSVLDLGCGEGRNAIYLASLGHHVTALDLSKNAIEKLRKISERLDLGIQTIVGDVGEFDPMGQRYDFVLAHCSLHFIPKRKWMPLLEKIRQLTNPGGFHNITSIMDTEQYPIPTECSHANSFQRGDLDRFYANWQVLRSDYYAKWDSHPNIAVHVHVVEKFVARNIAPNLASGIMVEKLENPGKLSESLFAGATIGMSASELVQAGIKPVATHRTGIDAITMGSTTLLEQGYVIEDWLFGTLGLQIINGQLRGKYHYFTDPVCLRAVDETGQ